MTKQKFTPAQRTILKLVANADGKIVPWTVLNRAIGRGTSSSCDDSLKVQIYRIRQDHPWIPIETVRGIGLRLKTDTCFECGQKLPEKE